MYSEADFGSEAKSSNLRPRIHPTFPDTLTYKGKTEKVKYYHTTRTVENMNVIAQVNFYDPSLTLLSAGKDRGLSWVQVVDDRNEEEFAVGCPYEKNEDSGFRNPNEPSLEREFQEALKKAGFSPTATPVPRVPVGVGARQVLCLAVFRRPC